MSRVGMLSARFGATGKGACEGSGENEQAGGGWQGWVVSIHPIPVYLPFRLLTPRRQHPLLLSPCSINLAHRGSWIISLVPLIPSAQRDKPHFIKKTSMTLTGYNVCYTEQNEQKKIICSQAIIMGIIFQTISKNYQRNLLLHPLS